MKQIAALTGYVRAIAGAIATRLTFSGGIVTGSNLSSLTNEVVHGNPTTTIANSVCVIGANRNAGTTGVTFVAPASPTSGQAFRVTTNVGGAYGGIDWYGNLYSSSIRASQIQIGRTDQASLPYTLSQYSGLCLRMTSTGAGTVTLPAANGMGSQAYFCWVLDGGGNSGSANITIARQGSDLIDNATSVTLAKNYGARCFLSDGLSRWYTVGGIYA